MGARQTAVCRRLGEVVGNDPLLHSAGNCRGGDSAADHHGLVFFDVGRARTCGGRDRCLGNSQDYDG